MDKLNFKTMDYKKSLPTPTNPLPSQFLHKRLPPRIVMFGHKAKENYSKIKINTYFMKKSENPIKSDDEESINPPILPVIQIKNKKFPFIGNNNNNFSKCLPKVNVYKPLFHDRNHSYIIPKDPDDDYFLLSNKITLQDY